MFVCVLDRWLKIEFVEYDDVHCLNAELKLCEDYLFHNVSLRIEILIILSLHKS